MADIISEDHTQFLSAKWNQLSGQVKQKWGELTDDDIDKVRGDRQELIGIIQERYDMSEEEARREVDQFLSAWQTKQLS